MTEKGPTKRLTKAFSDAIPLGPHPEPHAEWISVRLDFVQGAIDHLNSLENGNAELRIQHTSAQQQAQRAKDTVRVAMGHLTMVLSGCRTADEQMRADTLARDWLASIAA